METDPTAIQTVQAGLVSVLCLVSGGIALYGANRLITKNGEPPNLMAANERDRLNFEAGKRAKPEYERGREP